ncbi:MAG: hypothetical protein KME11_05935 [Timaviella obliquedivisa GSE-PSE-MK23-08B]|nr:hypothetical protein [Timaviella obliquedivisa GSE-PSE-MK23-08B]
MKSDNTFRKARDLGSFNSTQALRAKDMIGPSDKADVYKFTLTPTFGFRASGSFKSQGGSMRFSLFLLNPLTNKPTAIAAPAIINAGKNVSNSNFPATNMPFTFFIKFDKPTQNVKYQFALKPLA